MVSLRSLSRTALVAGLAGLVLAAVVLTWQLTDARGARGGFCDRLAAASAAALAESDTGSGPRIVVIGDSYSVGLGLDRADRAWPSRLPGRVRVAGFSGSGFSERAGGCRRASFADRAPAALAGGADLLVVEGGLNDTRHADAEITQGFEALVTLAGRTPVLVVGPPPAPARGVEEVTRVDGLLGALAARHGATYLSMADSDLPYLDDGLHLTAAGHDAFGDAVAAGVAAR